MAKLVESELKTTFQKSSIMQKPRSMNVLSDREFCEITTRKINKKYKT